MYSKLLTIATTLCLTIGAYAQSPIELAQRANNYFMAKWSDPTTPTNFKKLRPSNLWTRGVYYEGLIALNEVAPEEYDKVIEESKLEVVSRPQVDVVKMEKGQDLVFTATVATKPEVELGKYKGIEIKKIEVLIL